ncbi:MAG: MgtC/SapB family protein [Clostridia bacterium]|nr:MgtC/SapB family protein [Clostridia bacterium]
MDAVFDTIIGFEKELNLLTVLLRIVLAILFGGIIGFERSKQGRQAGMRTHIMVCMGGTMAALIGVYCTQLLGFGGDPFRIAAQVVSGIGFLGAGMIIVKSDRLIMGLTTAAIMWTTAIIGIALGLGFYSGALIAVAACVFVAAFMTRMEKRRKVSARIYIEICDLGCTEEVVGLIESLLPADSHYEVTAARSNTKGALGVSVTTLPDVDFAAFKKSLKETGGVLFVIQE